MSSDDCQCQVKFLNSYPDFEDGNLQKTQGKDLYSVLDFGCVDFGTKTFKKLRLLNKSRETVIYKIKRDPTSNPIYQAFDFNISRQVVYTKKHLEVKICYNPKLPKEINIDYLEISDTQCRKYWICLKGQSKGLGLQVSTKCLYFYYKPNACDNRKTVELTNTSNIATQFQFDVNENDEVFVLNKYLGYVEPRHYEFITITFNAKEYGIYHRHLVCLNSYNEPLMIELIGIVAAETDFAFEKIKFVSFPFSLKESRGYSGYLFGSVKMLEQLPPISLSVTYLDFGMVMVSQPANSLVMVTSLTNHLDKAVDISWHNLGGVFNIYPKDIVIDSMSSGMFEVKFTPKEVDKFYTKIITAEVNWVDTRNTAECEDVETINLPILFSLRVFGHSFPTEHHWIPQIEIIPDNIILPITIPNAVSYTTFILKTSGYLPVSFKFAPPKKTNFTLKPMIGVVKNFQIIVAQLQTDESNKKPYVECWGLECNGEKDSCKPFYLKGYSELPALNIGSGNNVKFNSIQYGCQECMNVEMKNVSGHYIEYEFRVNEHEYITIDHPRGFIAANEITYLDWYFTSSPKASPVSTICCELRPIHQMKSIRGLPIDSLVTVYADFGYSQLCTIPTSWECPEFLYDTSFTTKFHVFNFGEPAIHFKLNVSHNKDECVTLSPMQGSLKNKEKTEIIVHIHGKKLGQQVRHVYYQVRSHMLTLDLAEETRHNIFKISYNCVLPIVQIEEIGYHNFGPLFSKLILWEMLNIDGINTMLEELKPKETKEIHICTPDYEHNEEIFTTSLMLKNKTNFETCLHIKRKKMCECKLVEVTRGMSFRENIFDCPHRDLVVITYPEDKVYPKCRQKLTMKMNYYLEGFHTLCYIFRLSHERKLEVYIKMSVLSIPTLTCSMYTSKYILDFSNSYIGEKDPLLEGFYIYNNTSTGIRFFLDLTNVTAMNQSNKFVIIECIQEEGYLPAFTSHALLFKFAPLEEKAYEVSLPLQVGAEIYELKLSGEGSKNYNPNVLENVRTLSKRHICIDDDISVSLSTEHMVIDPFPVWSVTQRMFFIRNLTKDRTIGYSFQNCSIEGAVEARVLFRKGTLAPKESHAVIVEIRSFDRPCYLRLQMPCKLLDHTQYIEHKRSEAAYNLMELELKDQFTITEHEVTYPVNNLVVIPHPVVFYTTLALTLQITSLRDRDIYLNTTDQLKQSPQHTLKLSPNNLLKSFEPTDVELNLQEEPGESRSEETFTRTHTRENLLYFREVLDCYIADVLFSNMFNKMTDVILGESCPYYLQFIVDDKPGRYDNRRELIKKYVSKPQPPVIGNIFKELIADSIHQIFNLGPQVKHRQRPICNYEIILPETNHCKHSYTN